MVSMFPVSNARLSLLIHITSIKSSHFTVGWRSGNHSYSTLITCLQWRLESMSPTGDNSPRGHFRCMLCTNSMQFYTITLRSAWQVTIQNTLYILRIKQVSCCQLSKTYGHLKPTATNCTTKKHKTILETVFLNTNYSVVLNTEN